MPPDIDQERTEPATPKRRQEAREKGRVGKSKEIPSVLVLITGLMVLNFWGQGMYEELTKMMRGIFEISGTLRLEEGRMVSFAKEISMAIFKILIPFFSLSLFAGLLANYLQIGFVASIQAIQPRFSKIDPIQGFKKIFSKQSLAELIKGILKIAIVGCVAYLTIKGEFYRVFPLIKMEAGNILITMTSVAFKICIRTAWVLIALAILDYVFNKWEYERSLRMTKQEVKDEFKQREGDPLVKARVRSIQREMARKRMMAAVPKADVVITNPTEIAIALEYKKERMSAPEVTAKGAGFVAQRIKEIARENGVPIFEDKPLAQTLYRAVEIGREIPPNLYKAVAEVLAYIFRLKSRPF